MTFIALLPLLQLLANVGLTISGQYGVVPPNTASLAVQLETALGPLFAAIATKSTKTQDVMAALGAAIGALTVLKSQTGLDPAVLAKIDEQLAAAQASLAAEISAGSGFNAANYTPVAPIQ